MRRTILMLTAAVIMAAMMGASGRPALAFDQEITIKASPAEDKSPVITCFPRHAAGPRCIVFAPPPDTAGE
jgi:hypothetical protein